MRVIIKTPLLLLALILLIKGAILQWFVTQGSIGLGPDEAQYWTWSQLLDWGYYSKPPGVAWQIRAGTAIFGNTELGVRSGAILIGTLLSFAIYTLASTCRLKPWTCFFAAMTFAFTPLGLAASFLAITDGGMVLFWTLSTAAYCRMIDQVKPNNGFNYYLIGVLVLCGALFKWPIYLFWLFIAIWVVIGGKHFNRQFLGGIAISLLGLLPSLIWNSQHGWPTFKHVFSTIHNPVIENGTTDLMRGNFWDFIGAQAILISPLLFALLILSFWGLIRAWRMIFPSLQFCGASTLILLLCYSSMAIFKKMQGNWCDFAYPASMVILCWHACEYVPKRQPWIYVGISLSLAMTGLFLSIPYIEAKGIASCCQIPFKSNPFKHNLGWRELNEILTNLGYDPKKNFLFADRYQMSSILSFYGPEQKRAYFLNLSGIRNNQFSYWNGMDKDQTGHNGFFIVVENASYFVNNNEPMNKYASMLQPYFLTVEYLGEYPLFYSYGLPAKNAYVLKCTQYNGNNPPASILY